MYIWISWRISYNTSHFFLKQNFIVTLRQEKKYRYREVICYYVTLEIVKGVANMHSFVALNGIHRAAEQENPLRTHLSLRTLWSRAKTKSAQFERARACVGNTDRRLKMSKISKFFKGSSSSSSSSSSSKSKHHRSRGGPTAQEAIHKLRETEEMLTKKQDFLEKKIQQELMIAKKNGTKNKRGKLRGKYLRTWSFQVKASILCVRLKNLFVHFNYFKR